MKRSRYEAYGVIVAKSKKNNEKRTDSRLLSICSLINFVERWT